MKTDGSESATQQARCGPEQRLEERTSFSRGSIGKGSLTGRFSLTGERAFPGAHTHNAYAYSGGGGAGSYLAGSDAVSLGGSSAATRHWVNSVSDIYGPDEIEELLEDLNRLELAAGTLAIKETSIFQVF